MKNLAKILLIVILLTSGIASADQYQQYASNEQYASTNSGMGKYDQDFVSCSDTARKTTAGMSDSMYLGAFYGCMVNLGYNTAELF
jgi:hypothetical protein